MPGMSRKRGQDAFSLGSPLLQAGKASRPWRPWRPWGRSAAADDVYWHRDFSVLKNGLVTQMQLHRPIPTAQPQLPNLEQFKCAWADHGDAISLQYSGSHALKGDLTRTGRRTVGGLLQVLNPRHHTLDPTH